MRRAVLLSAIVLLAASACASDDPETAVTTSEVADGSSTTTPGDATTTTTPRDVTTTTAGEGGAAGPFIEDSEFHDLEVLGGADVTVTNRDDLAHTFSFEDESVSLSLGGGEIGTFTAPAAGEYPIYCEIHGSMSATLVVS